MSTCFFNYCINQVNHFGIEKGNVFTLCWESVGDYNKSIIILVKFTPGGHSFLYFPIPMDRHVIIFKLYSFNTSRHNMLS